LLRLPQWLPLQRWLEFLRWRLSQLRSLHWQPLSLQSPLSLLWLPLPGLQLVLPQLPSVVLALQVCPRPVPLLSIHFVRHLLLPQPLLPLQQQLSLQRPSRSLCRLLWFRYSLLLWSLRLLRLLLQLPQCLRLQRWLALFRWLQWRLRWRRWRQLSLQPILWSLPLPLPELRLVFLPLLSVVLALLACPKPRPLRQVQFARHWPLQLPSLPLQRLLSLTQPNRPLCRQSSLRWQSPSLSHHWRQQWPLQPQSRLLPRWPEFLRWLQRPLHWQHWLQL
jgi:hypothetical protein